VRKLIMITYIDGTIKQRPPPPSSPHLPRVGYAWAKERKVKK
jgi:hypothetical protein